MLPALLVGLLEASGAAPVPAYYAYAPGPTTCPGCRAAWSARFESRVVVCAYHGVAFDATGRAVA